MRVTQLEGRLLEVGQQSKGDLEVLEAQLKVIFLCDSPLSGFYIGEERYIALTAAMYYLDTWRIKNELRIFVNSFYFC